MAFSVSDTVNILVLCIQIVSKSGPFFSSGSPIGLPIPMFSRSIDVAMPAGVYSDRVNYSFVERDVFDERDEDDNSRDELCGHSDADRPFDESYDCTGDADRKFGTNDPTKSRISDSFSG